MHPVTSSRRTCQLWAQKTFQPLAYIHTKLILLSTGNMEGSDTFSFRTLPYDMKATGPMTFTWIGAPVLEKLEICGIGGGSRCCGLSGRQLRGMLWHREHFWYRSIRLRWKECYQLPTVKRNISKAMNLAIDNLAFRNPLSTNNVCPYIVARSNRFESTCNLGAENTSLDRSVSGTTVTLPKRFQPLVLHTIAFCTCKIKKWRSQTIYQHEPQLHTNCNAKDTHFQSWHYTDLER